MSEYIKREDVLAKAAPWKDAFCNLISSWDVVHLPKEDVAPVVHATWKSVGVWGMKGLRLYCQPKLECSMCGHRSEIKSKYCPNCGSRMDER